MIEPGHMAVFLRATNESGPRDTGQIFGRIAQLSRQTVEDFFYRRSRVFILA